MDWKEQLKVCCHFKRIFFEKSIFFLFCFPFKTFCLLFRSHQITEDIYEEMTGHAIDEAKWAVKQARPTTAAPPARRDSLTKKSTVNGSGSGSPAIAIPQGLFLGAWLGTHTSTMSRDVTDIHGDRADFAIGEEVQCHFS